MDVSEPATVVLPQGTAAVLRVLAGTNASVTVRQAARMAGVSHQRAGQVIDRLARHGLIDVQEQPPSLLCRLNRDHLAAQPLIALAQLRATLLATLVEEIHAWEVTPLHASLFGSAARGDGNVDSDLDVLVIHQDAVDPDRWADQLTASGRRLRRSTGNTVSWFDISPADLQRAVEAGEPIVGEWQRDGVRLVGATLARLVRRAS
jgi:predicted nucleotidyltransferase